MPSSPFDSQLSTAPRYTLPGSNSPASDGGKVGLRDVTVLAATHEDVAGTVTVIVDGTHVRLSDELVAPRIGGLALPQELAVVVHADEVVDIRRVLVVRRNPTGGLLRRIPGGDPPVLLGEGSTLVLGLLRDDIRRLAVLQM